MAAEQKIIQDLDKAFSGLTVTLETLQKVLAQNKAAQQEQIQYIESLKKAIGDSKEWRAFADATAKVTDAQKALTQQQKDALDVAKKEEQLKQQQIKTSEAARKALEAQSKSAEKANKQKQDSLSLYKQETDRLRELTKQAKEAAIQYGINSKEARKLRDEQQKLDRKIKDIDASLGIHNRNVGNYESALSGVKGMISKVTGFLGGFGLALGAGATVMKSFQMLVNSSQTAGDKWAISVGGMKGAIEGFFQALGTGNFDGIADAMERGARAGREYAAAIDDLFEGAQGVKILTAEYDLQISKQEQIRRDVTKTNDERRKAALEIVRLERLKLDVINTENDKTFKAEAQRVKTRTGLNEEDLISFLKTYREKESIRNAYFEEEKRLNDEIQKNIEKTTVSMGQFGGTQTVFTETPASKKARENLATFIASQSADMKIYLDLIDRYGGTTDEMVTKFTDAYVSITNAQTKSIDEQRKNNAFLAQSEKELNETRAETTSTTNDLIKIQEELLRQASELPGATEDEITARNKKIQVIDAEIKRLKDLGKIQAPEQLKAIRIDYITADADKAREELKKRSDQYIADWVDTEKQKTAITKQYADEREELQKEVNEKLGELFSEAGNTFFEVENEKYEKAIEANTAYYDGLLANEKLDDEQRKLIEAQKEQRENELKARQRANEKKQFLFNQAFKVGEILMDTAVKIAAIQATAKVLAANPLTRALAGIALAQIPLVKLSSALSIGTVIAQSIPQFDKGTESTPEKFIAGEKRPEIMVDKQGNATMVDRPTLFVGKQFEGNQIISGADTAKMLANAGNITNAMLLKAGASEQQRDNDIQLLIDRMIAADKSGTNRIVNAINGTKQKDNTLDQLRRENLKKRLKS
jgi:hypothetical protein